MYLGINSLFLDVGSFFLYSLLTDILYHKDYETDTMKGETQLQFLNAEYSHE